MIRPLRARHRRMLVVLALVLPALFTAAWLARPERPRMARLPGIVAPDPPPTAAALRTVADNRPGATVRAEVGRLADGSLAVRVEALLAPPEPDLLVYWAGGESGVDSGRLLGPLDGSRSGFLPLPAESATRAGRVLVYSLAHREVIAALSLPALGRSAAEE